MGVRFLSEKKTQVLRKRQQRRGDASFDSDRFDSDAVNNRWREPSLLVRRARAETDRHLRRATVTPQVYGWLHK